MGQVCLAEILAVLLMIVMTMRTALAMVVDKASLVARILTVTASGLKIGFFLHKIKISAFN